MTEWTNWYIYTIEYCILLTTIGNKNESIINKCNNTDKCQKHLLYYKKKKLTQIILLAWKSDSGTTNLWSYKSSCLWYWGRMRDWKWLNMAWGDTMEWRNIPYLDRVCADNEYIFVKIYKIEYAKCVEPKLYLNNARAYCNKTPM